MDNELEDSHCSATSGGTLHSLLSSGNGGDAKRHEHDTEGSADPPTPSPPPPRPMSIGDGACPIHSHVMLRDDPPEVPQRSPGGECPLTSSPRVKSTSVNTTLRKSDVLKNSTLRQHYYPEGGWGWLIGACAFIIHLLTNGMQMAYGVLYIYVLDNFGSEYVTQAGWLGALSFCVSHLVSPLVVAICQRKSTRLTAVFGGLITALACLFTSFAQQMHQTFVSYGFMLGLGVGMTTETSNLMIGQYFKRRREIVEILVQTASGIGTALFSVLFREAIGSVGWRLGLQMITVVLFSSFILGMLYRSASLYHPQRRAILHLKYQMKKVKDKSGRNPSYFDFATLKTRTLQIIMLSTAMASMGIYAPIFYLALHCKQEGIDMNSIILLQTFLGFAFALGNIGFGLVVIRHSDQCYIARQYLLQASLCGLGMTLLTLTSIRGYHSYVLFTWMYGVFLGGYHYSLKVYTYEKTRARYFTRSWGFVQWAKALPVLFGVPITGYINQGAKSGFYFASALTFAGASCLFLMNLRGKKMRKRDATVVTFSTIESRVIPPYIHSIDGALATSDHNRDKALTTRAKMDKVISFATTSMDVPDVERDEPLKRIKEEGGAKNSLELDDDDDCYGCITSCDKVEYALVFSDYEEPSNGDQQMPKEGRQSDWRTEEEGRGEEREGEETAYEGREDVATQRQDAPNMERMRFVRDVALRRSSITLVEEMTTSV